MADKASLGSSCVALAGGADGTVVVLDIGAVGVSGLATFFSRDSVAVTDGRRSVGGGGGSSAGLSSAIDLVFESLAGAKAVTVSGKSGGPTSLAVSGACKGCMTGSGAVVGWALRGWSSGMVAAVGLSAADTLSFVGARWGVTFSIARRVLAGAVAWIGLLSLAGGVSVDPARIMRVCRTPLGSLGELLICQSI